MAKHFNIYTDGSGTRGVIGFAAYVKELNIYLKGSLATGTVSTAEWNGLLLGLKACVMLQEGAGGTQFLIHSDSKLIVNQYNRDWANNKFHRLQARADSLRDQVRRRGGVVNVMWVPRELNEHADKVAKHARRSLIDTLKV